MWKSNVDRIAAIGFPPPQSTLSHIVRPHLEGLCICFFVCCIYCHRVPPFVTVCSASLIFHYMLFIFCLSHSLAEDYLGTRLQIIIPIHSDFPFMFCRCWAFQTFPFIVALGNRIFIICHLCCTSWCSKNFIIKILLKKR